MSSYFPRTMKSWKVYKHLQPDIQPTTPRQPPARPRKHLIIHSMDQSKSQRIMLPTHTPTSGRYSTDPHSPHSPTHRSSTRNKFVNCSRKQKSRVSVTS